MKRGRDFAVVQSQRQLFLDDEGVDEIENLYRTMHQPSKKGAVIRPALHRGITCIQTRSAPAWDPQEEAYKLWYLASGRGNASGTAYAESRDGLHWQKPILRRKEINGSLENNFVTVDPKLEWPANAMENVVYDPYEPDPLRRYKALGHCFGREPLVSPNGIDWKRLDVPSIPSGDESNMSFDETERLFVATVKHAGPRHDRAVYLSTSVDFEKWTAPELIFHADDLDQQLGRLNIEWRFANPAWQQPVFDIPAKYRVDVYNMGTFRYEGLYVGLPSMFHRTGRVSGDWPGFADWEISPGQMAAYQEHGDWSGFHHVQLISSRDLHHWERLGDRQPFIGPSPLGSGAYDLATIIGPSFPVVRGDELWFYYTGIKEYGGPSPLRGVDRDRGAICLAVLRRDGFISLDAGYEEGSLLTQPFVTPAGDLHLNVDAAKGRAVVQVCDQFGEGIPGFEASQGIEGDYLDTTVGWPDGQMNKLAGKRIRLRIALRHAQLYSYWIT